MPAFPYENLHLDRMLSGFSTQLRNRPSIVNQLVTPITVNKQTDAWYRWENKAQFTASDDVRAPGARATRITGQKFLRDTYYCPDHALEIAITDEERAQADDPIRPEMENLMLLENQLEMARAERIIAMVNNANNYYKGFVASPNPTAGGGSQQWDEATADIVTQVREIRLAMHKKIFVEPNVVVVPYQVCRKLEDNTQIIERIKYVMPGFITEDLLASLWGMRVVVPETGIIGDFNPAADARTGSPEFKYQWRSPSNGSAPGPSSGSYLSAGDLFTTPSAFSDKDDNVLFAYVPQMASTKQVAFVYEFIWTGPDGAGQSTYRRRLDANFSDAIITRRFYNFYFGTIDEPAYFNMEPDSHGFGEKKSSGARLQSLAGMLLVNVTGA